MPDTVPSIASRRPVGDLLLHEVRGLLTPLSGRAQLLRSNSTHHGDGAELADAVLEALEKLERLTKLLTHDPDVDRQASPTLLRDLIESVLRSLDSDASRVPRQIQCQIPLDLACPIDPVAAERVVWNLVSNSIRHCGPEVKIKISARSTGNTSQATELVVEDSGPQPHSTTPASGMGVGLIVVEGLLRANGASLSVTRSALGGRRSCIQFGGESHLQRYTLKLSE